MEHRTSWFCHHGGALALLVDNLPALVNKMRSVKNSASSARGCECDDFCNRLRTSVCANRVPDHEELDSLFFSYSQERRR